MLRVAAVCLLVASVSAIRYCLFLMNYCKFEKDQRSNFQIPVGSGEDRRMGEVDDGAAAGGSDARRAGSGARQCGALIMEETKNNQISCLRKIVFYNSERQLAI